MNKADQSNSNTEKSAQEISQNNQSVKENDAAPEANGVGAQKPNSDVNSDSTTALTEKLRDLQKKLEESEKKYIYLYAENENYKKRSIKERSELLRYGWESAAHEMLLILDNIERAMTHVPQNTDKNFVTGLEMVFKQFKNLLNNQGIREVECANKTFDPLLHEAISREYSEKVKEGEIIEKQQSGYMLYDRLLRAPKVVVSRGPKKNNDTQHTDNKEKTSFFGKKKKDTEV